MDYMNEIDSDELYKALLGHGMFAEKLPPIFTSEPFYDYCVKSNPNFSDMKRQYVYYENMRNINIPRPLGIPVPMAYQKLCKFLADNWEKIKNHFSAKTSIQLHKVSRIHIRKMYDKDYIFEMNYGNWRNDGSPENNLIYKKEYVVQADISKCFPSIYTHSLSWALAGKSVAKTTKNNKTLWYNQIDHLVQMNKDGETHGLLIGPHVSNLLSEIILCCVDYELVNKGWEYIRNIDDYTCFVATEEKAKEFLVDLQTELRKYDLSLNHKKTQISKLPIAMTEQWTRKIKAVTLLKHYGKVDYKNCQTYFDYAIEIAEKEKGNASVLNFAIKTLSGLPLTDNAKSYEKDIVFHLCVLYPYLVPLLEEYVFGPCDVTVDEIEKLSKTLFDNGIKSKTYEQAAYAIYYALKYGFSLAFTVDMLIATGDCVLLVLGLLSFRKVKDKTAVAALKDHAKNLAKDSTEMERMWLFVYETLPQTELHDDWKALKKAKVTFIKSI